MSETSPKTPEPASAGTGRSSFFWIVILATLVAAAVAVGGIALLVNIMERQQEARNPFYRVVELTDETVDPAIWGQNFPLQYDDYQRTVDQIRTRHGGSEAVPRTPDEADPRSIVARSLLEEDPRLKIIWSGYPFAVDAREARGHAYMLEDATFTQRQQAAQQPGTCLNCHTSAYVPYMQLGDGDIHAGFEKFNQMTFQETRALVEHPVSCIDCHEPEAMKLRVTRPAFMEGMRVWKASQGVEDFDVNTMATRQEMRTYVCAQCHVEYYFEGPEKRLTFPWHNGLKADEILEYFDEIEFHDWVHEETGAKVLKAQHPEFELWNQGVHARAEVACTDCHMPYKRVGAMKISDHHVRSPLLNLNRACQTCHRWEEDDLRSYVATIQERTFDLRNSAMDALVELIEDIKGASESETPEESLAHARTSHRKAQFLIDFVEAENSMGFHAPQEAARLLGEAMNHVRRGQVAIRERGDSPGDSNVSEDADE